MMKKHQGVKSIGQTSKSTTIKMIRFLSSKYEFVNNVILNEILIREKGNVRLLSGKPEYTLH